MLQKHLDELRTQGADDADEKTKKKPAKDRPKPKGRRDLSLSTLPQVVVELTDPELAATGELIGFEESRQLQQGSVDVSERNAVTEPAGDLLER